MVDAGKVVLQVDAGANRNDSGKNSQQDIVIFAVLGWIVRRQEGPAVKKQTA